MAIYTVSCVAVCIADAEVEHWDTRSDSDLSLTKQIVEFPSEPSQKWNFLKFLLTSIKQIVVKN